MGSLGLTKLVKEKVSKFLSITLVTSILPVLVVGNLVSTGPIANATGYTTIPLETSTVVTSPGFVELGSLASRSKSTVAVKKAITKSSVSPYTITGTDSLSGQSYQYQTLQNYTGNTLFESMDVTSTIVAAGGPNYGLGSKSWSFDPAASYGGRSNVNRLTSSMASIPRTSGQAPYGSVFGPEVWSAPFVGNLGKSISFDWAAANGQDDYEIYAFLVKIDSTTVDGTCSAFSGAGTYGLTNPTTTHTLMAYGRGTTQTWLTATAAVPSAGCYRFRFVSGTYDQTGGLAVGASLYVDNTVLLGDTQTITFPSISDRLRDASNAQTLNAGATSDATGATLVYSTSTSSVCLVDSSTGLITIASGNTGTCTITVNSGAVGTFTAASPVTRSFAIVANATVPSSQNGSYISGNAATCETLSVVEGGWNTGGATISGTTYQWQTSTNGSTWTNISGATSSTYLTTGSDYNNYIRVQIVKSNSVGASNPESTSGLLISTQSSGCSTVSSNNTTAIIYPSSLITFAQNGADNSSFPQSEILGDTKALWKNIMTRAGYTFAGWNTKADGTGTSYADGAQFKFDAPSIVLYAQWKLVQTKPTISWATPVPIQEGTALSATQLNALASVAGTYTYSPAASTALAPGKHTLKVTFVPTDAKYETIEATVEIEVLAKAKVTWANPASITEGTPLSGIQLNATASVPGTFTYEPKDGALLAPGKYTLKVTFTPTDSRLSPVAAEATIEVVAKPVVIPAPPVAPKYSVTGAPKTTVTWGAGKDAATYTVLVDGKSTCSVAALTCEVAKLLGPKNVVTVTSVASSGKASAAVPATYVAPAASQVLTVVNFDSARAVIKSAEATKLRAFATTVKAAGYTSLTVFGHTDSVGGVDNQKLSVARANAAITYLKKLLPGVKFVVSGFAASEPVADNSTAEGKAANRRAEIFIP